MKMKTDIVFVALALSACSGSPPPPRQEQPRTPSDDLVHANADIGVVPPDAEPTKPLTPSETASVCKAAIAELFGHSPKIMKAAPQGSGTLRISYKRPDDGKGFKNDCQLQGNRIMWRGVDISSGTGPGRWRNHPDDEVLTFKIKGSAVELTTTYSDGSSATEKQPLL